MMSLHDQYKNRYEKYLVSIARKLEINIKENLDELPRIDRVTARAKGIKSFLDKSNKEESGEKKYRDPLKQIQDQIGVRIVTFYLNDVESVSEKIEGYYRKIESKKIVPDSHSEFGYFGKHFILLLPDDIVTDDVDRSQIPDYFELQVKTLFQHAWGEAEHDLGYKPGEELSGDEKRKIAFTAAQAWGADQIFNELSNSLNN